MNSNAVKIFAGFLVAGIVALLFFVGFTYYDDLQKEKVTVLISGKEIPPRTLITPEMFNDGTIGTIDVPVTVVPPNVAMRKEDIIGKYTITNYTIPQYSYLYLEKILPPEDIKDGTTLLLKEGESMVAIETNLRSSLAAQIVEGSYINLWLVAEDEEKRPVVGPFLERIRVIGAYSTGQQRANPTSSQAGSGVYQNREIPALGQNIVPSTILLAVSDDQAALIQLAELLGRINIVGTSQEPPTGENNIDDREFSLTKMQAWMKAQLSEEFIESMAMALENMTVEREE